MVAAEAVGVSGCVGAVVWVWGWVGAVAGPACGGVNLLCPRCMKLVASCSGGVSTAA